MTTYRLRLEVPLRSDAETATTSALDRVGGDVVSVDLREVDGAHAIDEVVVRFPQDPDGTTLHRALEHAPTTLLSSRRCEPDEPITQAREWVRTQSTLPDADTDLEEQLSIVCPLSSVAIRPAADARVVPVVQMALERGGPVALRCAGLPDGGGPGDPASVWLLAVPDRYPDADAVALLSRPVSLRFTAGEAARVGVLMAGAR